MVAFEIAKRLESNQDEVKFLGSWNLPPHIKSRMRQLDWIHGLLHLAYFLDLITEEQADDMAAKLRGRSKEEALQEVMLISDNDRLQQLTLTSDTLAKWTDLSFNLQRLAVDYEPTGLVASIDVFIAKPLRMVALSRDEWLSNHLSKWDDFVRRRARFHDVDGSHYTMISPKHVAQFHEKLRCALAARGI
jgi:thioesterase domain-containing protein